MRVVLSWLQDLVPVGDDVDSIVATLTDLGLVVDAVEHVGATVDGVVTARVLRTERHPDAAKVHRVFVDTGDGAARHVWCGAFNMQAGDVVPLATPGTTMPDGRRIEPKPILGIASDGMLCSARELGLGDDHAGILILPAATPLGVPYGAALGLATETVFDLDVTRNMPDCFGHYGVARQLAARRGPPLRPNRVRAPAGGRGPRRASVDIVAPERCPRFTATVVSGVRITDSPEWIARRLTAAGMRPINNVVDASNYVMLELNQPNHAYDLETLGGRGFRVRLAAEGESMTTLDGARRTLTTDDLLITDAADVPIGLAGIMGGLESEVAPATTTIALEVAFFDHLGIAASVGRTGLRSEASMRFERIVDWDGMAAAAARFVELLGETCPDLRVEQTTDELITGPSTPHTEIVTDAARINRVLGTALDAEQIRDHLRPLGFVVDAQPDGGLAVVVPSYRPDCVASVDLAEEVARQYGYDRVGKTVPRSAMHGHLSAVQHRRRQLRQVLIGLGLSEAMPNPFLADGDLERARLDGAVVRIVNSLVLDESVLRTSLRPGLLKAIAHNESHRRPGAALFEIGRVYPPGSGELPDEYEALGVVLAGRTAPAAIEVWRELVVAMGFGARIDQGTVPAGLHPTRSATLSLGKTVVGAVGEVHPDVLDAYGIVERVAVLEVHLTQLLAQPAKIAAWKPTSRYPSSDLDLAIVTPTDVAAERIDKAIRQSAGALLADLRLFDVYRGAGVPDGARSLAYRLRLQAADRTLTDAEVAELTAKVVAAVGKFGAHLRA